MERLVYVEKTPLPQAGVCAGRVYMVLNKGTTCPCPRAHPAAQRINVSQTAEKRGRFDERSFLRLEKAAGDRGTRQRCYWENKMLGLGVKVRVMLSVSSYGCSGASKCPSRVQLNESVGWSEKQTRVPLGFLARFR